MTFRSVRAMQMGRWGERGAALVIVLLFMVVALILITSVLAISGNEIQISGLHRDSVRALELAQAGIQEAVQRIAANPPRFLGVGSNQGTQQCQDNGFTPSVPLADREGLKVGWCVRSSPGGGITIYEFQADATVGVAVRRLSAIVRTFINNIPPEIILSRDFTQSGSSSVAGGDVYTDSFAVYQALPLASQRSFAGWYIRKKSEPQRCYRWPCSYLLDDGSPALNLYPGHRRLMYLTGPNADGTLADLEANTEDLGTCQATNTTNPGPNQVIGVRADDPTQTSGPIQVYGYDTDPEIVEYVLGNTPSGVPAAPGTDFNNLLDANESEPAGSVSFSVAGGGTPEDSFAFTPAGWPGANGRAGNYAVVLNITNNVSSSVEILVNVERVNSDGSLIGSGVKTSYSVWRPARKGVMIFPLYDVNLGTWLPGNRLKVIYSFRNTGVPSRTVTLETGKLNERVSLPFGTEDAKTGDHLCGLPYKYVAVPNVLDEDGTNVGTRYFKTLALEHWFATYYEFVAGGDNPGYRKRGGTADEGCTNAGSGQDICHNPQFTAIPPFPSDAFIEALIDQASASQTRTGGGTITGGSGLDFGCPPMSTPGEPLDPDHAPGCNPAELVVIALLDDNPSDAIVPTYTINSNINGHGTIVVQGNLKMNGDLAWVGTIYVTGDVAFGAGGATITGGLVTKGSTEAGGEFKVYTGQDAGEVNVSNELTVILISMWER